MTVRRTFRVYKGHRPHRLWCSMPPTSFVPPVHTPRVSKATLQALTPREDTPADLVALIVRCSLSNPCGLPGPEYPGDAFLQDTLESAGSVRLMPLSLQAPARPLSVSVQRLSKGLEVLLRQCDRCFQSVICGSHGLSGSCFKISLALPDTGDHLLWIKDSSCGQHLVEYPDQLAAQYRQ